MKKVLKISAWWRILINSLVNSPMLGAVVLNNQHDGRTFVTKSRVHNCELNECDENGKLRIIQNIKWNIENVYLNFIRISFMPRSVEANEMDPSQNTQNPVLITLTEFQFRALLTIENSAAKPRACRPTVAFDASDEDWRLFLFQRTRQSLNLLERKPSDTTSYRHAARNWRDSCSTCEEQL